MPDGSNTTRRERNGRGVSNLGAASVLLILTILLVEEKYGHRVEGDDTETDSEDDVSEDDDAELITEDLDAQISATLQAIRAKDPRVYNPDVKFYQDDEGDDEEEAGASKKEKSMTLKDYHTKNLLDGKFGPDEEEEAPRKTYVQEQEEARQNLVKELHAGGSDEEDEDFLVAKPKSGQKKEDRIKITERDVENADKDPETFLSNFMAARAWVPSDGARFKPLESDDDEEDNRAEEFEAAYNLYFEDPSAANEKIMTYARDTIAATSVRREDPNGRKKAREAARAKREAEKRQREQDIARLRKLKIEELEDKVKHIRKVAGLTGREFKMEDWTDLLEGDFSDGQWDAEMQKRFGDAYYEQGDAEAASESEEDGFSKKKNNKKPKKPKWDDDIAIHDLIPDFDEEELTKPPLELLSDEEDADVEMEDANGDEDDEDEQSARKSSKQRKKERAEAKSSSRRDRRLIERLVDQSLEADIALATSSKAPARFPYRETSPTTFGLTARDILLADDSALNEFAGLKKLATFRDPVKKKKDKKALSKKARLRAWRMQTFGDEEGPKGGFESLLGEEPGVAEGSNGTVPAADGVDVREGDGKKKKKRSRKRKAVAVEE